MPTADVDLPASPNSFVDLDLRQGDILMAKDSNVGECCFIESDRWRDYAFSSGIVRVRPVKETYYTYAFMKHPLFKAQLTAQTARGSTISHSKSNFLETLIPFPNVGDASAAVSRVEALAQSIIEKEMGIRERHESMMRMIDAELRGGQKATTPFVYEYPQIDDLVRSERLDTGLYAPFFREQIFRVRNYVHGADTFEKLKFESIRGQNLQVSAIGKSIYADRERAGYYRLWLPTSFSEHGTVGAELWLGNRRKLAVLRKGDVVFGAEGTFRAIVLCEDVDNTITNIHAIILRSETASEAWKIFAGAWLRYLAEIGVMDAVAVGGHGGSVAQNYWGSLLVPKFPDPVVHEISRLYSEDGPRPGWRPTLSSLVQWHREWNTNLGIFQLDREVRRLRLELRGVQDAIIAAREAAPFVAPA